MGSSELALPFTRSPASLRSSSASSQTSSLKWMPPHTSSLSQDHNVNYSAMQVKLQYSPGDSSALSLLYPNSVSSI